MSEPRFVADPELAARFGQQMFDIVHGLAEAGEEIEATQAQLDNYKTVNGYISVWRKLKIEIASLENQLHAADLLAAASQPLLGDHAELRQAALQYQALRNIGSAASSANDPTEPKSTS